MACGSHKGSEFEREICKAFSRWFTGGERDDVFWRSSQSGGRATQRRKKGIDTFGSHGDMTALDPIGNTFMQWITLEMKRGRSHGCSCDLLELRDDAKGRHFEGCLAQAIAAHQAAKSVYWGLIMRRDRRLPILYLPARAFVRFGLGDFEFPRTRYRVRVDIAAHRGKGRRPDRRWITFVALPLQAFFDHASPRLFTQTP